MVSIIMPAYNAEQHIEEAIRSVIGQTYSDWELLIIDDRSTDDTYCIAEQLAQKDSRIKLFRNEVNLGVAKTRNNGFTYCSGEFVALLDSDDVWFENKLESQLTLIKMSGADIVYSSYQIINESGQKACADFIVPKQTNYNDFLVESVISCSTVLMNREIIDKYRFNTELYHEDLVLWLQLLRDGYKAYGVPDVLAQYRVYQGTRSANKVKSAINRFKVYREYLGVPFYTSCMLLFKYAIRGLRKYKNINVISDSIDSETEGDF